MSMPSSRNGAVVEYAFTFHHRYRNGAEPSHDLRMWTGIRSALLSFDELTLGVELQRRTIAQKLESERRAARDLEIARQVQARLFPQRIQDRKSTRLNSSHSQI